MFANRFRKLNWINIAGSLAPLTPVTVYVSPDGAVYAPDGRLLVSADSERLAPGDPERRVQEDAHTARKPPREIADRQASAGTAAAGRECGERHERAYRPQRVSRARRAAQRRNPHRADGGGPAGQIGF